MRTALRVVALLFLVAVAADSYLLTHRNTTMLVAGCALVAGATVWRDAVIGPGAIAGGALYLTALLVGHVPYDGGGLFVGAALVAYVNVSAWSAATPRHARIAVQPLVTLIAGQVAALLVGTAAAGLVVVGRSQASRASVIPWVAGLATLAVALLVPALRAGAADRD